MKYILHSCTIDGKGTGFVKFDADKKFICLTISPHNASSLESESAWTEWIKANTVFGDGVILAKPENNEYSVWIDMPLEEVEACHIARVLAKSRTLGEAAATLGIDQATLYQKRKLFEKETGSRPAAAREVPSWKKNGLVTKAN